MATWGGMAAPGAFQEPDSPASESGSWNAPIPTGLGGREKDPGCRKNRYTRPVERGGPFTNKEALTRNS